MTIALHRKFNPTTKNVYKFSNQADIIFINKCCMFSYVGDKMSMEFLIDILKA